MGYFTQVFVIPAVITIAYFYGPLLINEPSASVQNLKAPQTQLTKAGPILRENGSLAEAGYMTQPLKYFDHNDLSSFQAFRLKRWDYYDIITDDMVVSLALANLYIAGEVRIAYFNFETREAKHYRKLILPSALPRLSNTSYRFTNEHPEDNEHYEDLDISIAINNLGGKGLEGHNRKHITAKCGPLDLNLDFTMDLATNQEIMAATVPLDDTWEYFFYTLKMANGITEGKLQIGENTHQFNKANSGGSVDWTRAVWTYNTYWVWARAQGVIEGKRFSLNLGSGYGDNNTIAATEDGFFLDTKLFKLNAVEPKFDDNNLNNPFKFEAAGDGKGGRACDIVFAPNKMDKLGANYLILKSEMRIVYGQYSGWVSDEKGKKYKFENLNGYAEVFKTKW